MTGQVHGDKQKPLADHGASISGQQTPVGGTSVPTETNQPAESMLTHAAKSSQGQEDEAAVCPGAGATTFHKKPNTSSTTNGDGSGSSAERREPLTSTDEGLSEFSEANKDSADATQNTSDTTEGENQGQEVRGPAVLEKSTPSPSEEMLNQDPTLKKPLDSQKMSASFRQSQKAEVKGVGDKKVTESRQGSSSDPATSTTDGSSTKDSQKKPKEAKDVSPLGSNKKDKEKNEVTIWRFFFYI